MATKQDDKPAHTGIYAALAAAQTEMGRAAKDQKNPHFKSKYADLSAVQDACLPALHKYGFAVYQPLVRDDSGLAVKTVLAHESGETLECAVPLILAAQNMQGLGSAITYARRYGLFCMSGVAPEDDDGNAAVEQAPKQHRQWQPGQYAAEPPKEETPFDGDRGVDPQHEAAAVSAASMLHHAKDMNALRNIWSKLQKAIQADPRVIKAKDERKAELSAPPADEGDPFRSGDPLPEEF